MSLAFLRLFLTWLNFDIKAIGCWYKNKFKKTQRPFKYKKSIISKSHTSAVIYTKPLRYFWIWHAERLFVSKSFKSKFISKTTTKIRTLYIILNLL